MNNNVDKVFNYIQEKISTKEWDIGDKIASEIPLAKELGVSRSGGNKRFCRIKNTIKGTGWRNLCE